MASKGITIKKAIDCSQIADWSQKVGWDVDYQQVGRGVFEGKFSTASCGNLRVTQQYCNRELAARGVPPHGMMSVLLPLHAENQTVIQGRALGENDAAVMAAGSEGLLKSPRDLRMCTVSVSQAQLESALWDYGRCELLSVLSNCGVTPFPRKVIQNLMEVLNAVTCSTFVMEEKLVQLEAEDQILQAICEGLFSQEYQVTGRERAKYVFQARAYIDAHLGEVLRVGQIASDVGVSGRTLELAFREVVGVRVVEYIRTRRLNRARQLLLKRPVSGKPITEAAMQCGLFHLGYFSRDYGRLFGELPSQTLKRSNGQTAAELN